jgi:hypothetical protein
VYHPIPDTGATWCERRNILSSPPFCCQGTWVIDMSYKYYLGADTTIGPYIYKKLLSTGDSMYHSAGPTTCQPSPPPNCLLTTYDTWVNRYHGAIREDLNARKVYIFTNQEYLLYDFDLNVGDTLPNTYLQDVNGPNPSDYVSSIDSVLVGPNYHKRLWLTKDTAPPLWEYIALIEGVGTSMGLLSPLIVPFETIYRLECYSLFSVPHYTTSMNCNCPFTTKIEDTVSTSEVNIFPNPGSGIFSIEATAFIQEIQIRDLLGNILLKRKLNSLTEEIDISGFSKGVYLLYLNDEKGYTVTRKIILQ